MQENSEIKQLLYKFIFNQCNLEESNAVVAYYRKNKLTDDFPSVEDIQNLLQENSPQMSPATADAIFTDILAVAKETETINIKKTPVLKYLSIAASIVILLSVGWSYQKGFLIKETQHF